MAPREPKWWLEEGNDEDDLYWKAAHNKNRSVLMFPTYSKNDATVNNTKASVTPSTTTEMYIVLPGK